MAERSARMETMRMMFFNARHLCTWELDGDLRLVETNCASSEFFYNSFFVSFCRRAVEKHCSEHRTPAIVTDRVDIAWICEPCYEGETLRSVYLLGPFFSTEATEAYIRQLCAKMKISFVWTNNLVTQLSLVPTLAYSMAADYGVMLHTCITGEKLDSGSIIWYSEIIDAPEQPDPDWGSTSWHGTWQAERELFDRIREGNFHNMEELLTHFSAGRIGAMSDDPLRQAQLEGITFTVLASRAAIQGGISPEGGYNMADHYIRRIEAARTVTDVQSCDGEMLSAFVHRVRQCRKNSQYSPMVASCMEFIETHVCEKISLEAMAKEVGYTGYYLSRKFQQEIGEAMTNYIKRRKVEIAKQMLETQAVSSAEVSERLSFSSPSYFSATFKHFTGMSPTEYQLNAKENRK